MAKDYEIKCEKSFNQGRLEVLRDMKSFLEDPLVTMPAEEYLSYLKGAINDLIEESND